MTSPPADNPGHDRSTAVLASLADAASRRLDCKLAFAPADGLPLTIQSRFGAASGDESTVNGSVGLHCPAEHLAAFHGRISIGTSVAANFRLGPDDFFFCSQLLKFEPGASKDEICLRLAIPDELIATQRRKSFRIDVTADDAIAMRLWRIDDYVLFRDRPKPSQELACTLRDLGTGGLRAIVRAPRLKALALAENQRFRIELTAAGATPMLFDGRLRHPRKTERDDEQAVCGIRFVHRDNDIDGRRDLQKLQAVLARLQRKAAARRDAA